MCDATGIELVILRPAPIVGEGGRGNISRLIKAIDRNLFFWIGDGGNLRSLVYVGDVARAIEVSLDIRKDITILNVSGEAISIKGLVDVIAGRLGKKIPRLIVPVFAVKGVLSGSAVSFIPGVYRGRQLLDAWLANAVYSGAAFHRRYGFSPKTTIEEAVSREVEHFLRNR
jgi:nucleoside-diphosphate-sugar epimerase